MGFLSECTALHYKVAFKGRKNFKMSEDFLETVRYYKYSHIVLRMLIYAI